MLERASGQFTIEGNVEDIFGGISGATRIARISQTCRFTGALEGESIAEYTAVLPRESDGCFQGFQRISGALGEREGTFVVCVTGDYVKGNPRGAWTIVPKSGSGDFVHIRGGGTFSQSAGKPGSYKLEFDLRKPRKARDANTALASETTELVPGIDLVAEEAPTPEVESIVVTTPVVDASVTKPARHPRKKVEPIEPEPIVAVVEPQATPKRSRKRVDVVPDQTTPTSHIAEESFAPKRTRKPKPSVVEVEAAIIPEPASKPRRRQVDARIETSTPAPVSDAPRKRSRKSPAVEAPAPVIAEAPAITDRKPTRRQKASPAPDPLPLASAESNPSRSRKAKAA